MTAQEKRYVEELAFYHLTNLAEIDKSLQDMRFYTSGSLRQDTTGNLDTLLVKLRDTLFVPNPFPGSEVVEEKSLQRFDIPASLRGKKTAHPLQIKHFLKSGRQYYVHFSCLVNEYEGLIMVLVLNMKGDLTHYKIVPFAK